MAESNPIEVDTSTKVDKGRCLCGAVTFEVRGEPIYNVICHCANCKRQGGSTLHTASIFLKSQYTIHTGSSNITIYNDPETSSGQPLQRAFCKICGSKISASTPLNKDIISIPAGILETAGLEWVPHKEQFCITKAMWVPDFGDRIVQKFKRGPGGEIIKE